MRGSDRWDMGGGTLCKQGAADHKIVDNALKRIAETESADKNKEH